jgi:putative ABC transport system permease protein
VPGVVHVTGGANIPGAGTGPAFTVPAHGEGMPPADRIDVAGNWVERDFTRTFGLEIVAGRDFSADFPADTLGALLVNEAAVAAFGWDEPLGKAVTFHFGEETVEGHVVGVVKDFHFESLHGPIRPLVFNNVWVHTRSYLALRVRPDHLAATLAGIEAAWKRLAPEWPLDLQFLDEQVGAQYREEERLGRITTAFTFLALFIACLGLFGLASYATAQRTKEVGVRKVLGATAPGLVALLSKDFARLVLIAFVLAAPAAYLVLERWLDQFAYRITLSWMLFAAVGLSALALALLTVSYQAVRAALADPVKALRYE